MPRPDAYEIDPAHEQAAEDFYRNTQPLLDALAAVLKAGDCLFHSADDPNVQMSIAELLADLEALIAGYEKSRDVCAQDIKAGMLDVPTSTGSAA